MTSLVTLLLIPILPAAFCGAMSVGRRVSGWLALSWVITLAIHIAINLVIIFSDDVFPSTHPGASYIMTGKAIGAAIAMSIYWIVTGVLTFFVIRRLRMGRDAGGDE